MNTRDTAVRVRGILRCAKVTYRTRTRDTRFGNTAGKPIPVAKPKPGSAGEPASIPAQPDRPDSPPRIARAVATLLDNCPVRNPDGFFDRLDVQTWRDKLELEVVSLSSSQ